MMSKQDMENPDPNEQSDHDLIYKEMLHDIRDKSQTHPNVNKQCLIYVCYFVHVLYVKLRRTLRQRR